MSRFINEYVTFSVRNKELCALGYFVKKFCYLIDEKLKKEVHCIFWKTFEMEIVHSRKLSQHLLCGFFMGFMYFCETFNLKKDNNEDFKLIQKLYVQIKSFAILPKEKVKIGNRGKPFFN